MTRKQNWMNLSHPYPPCSKPKGMIIITPSFSSSTLTPSLLVNNSAGWLSSLFSILDIITHRFSQPVAMIDWQCHDRGSFFSHIKPGLFILLNLYIDFLKLDFLSGEEIKFLFYISSLTLPPKSKSQNSLEDFKVMNREGFILNKK